MGSVISPFSVHRLGILSLFNKEQQYLQLYDKVLENRLYPHLFYFVKYLFEIFNALFFVRQSHQMYYINSVVI